MLDHQQPGRHGYRGSPMAAPTRAGSRVPASPRRTASARASSGVGSRLTITSLAPSRLALTGRPAAGWTTSEPTATGSVAGRGQGLRLAQTSGGMFWPNDTVAALMIPAGQAGQVLLAGLDPGHRLAHRPPLAAGQANELAPGPVHLADQLGGQPGVGVQPVDVLGDHPGQPPRLGQPHARQMGRVGPRVHAMQLRRNRRASRRVPGSLT